MKWEIFLPYLLVMAGVTYLIRMIPLTAVRGRIKSRFLRSFLYYVPYAVLSAMTFPAILYSTGSLHAAAIGAGVALVLAYLNQPLTLVALAACVAAFLAGMIV